MLGRLPSNSPGLATDEELAPWSVCALAVPFAADTDEDLEDEDEDDELDDEADEDEADEDEAVDDLDDEEDEEEKDLDDED